MTLNRNLVITKAGRESVHTIWLNGSNKRNFDLIVFAYDEDVMINDDVGIVYVYLPSKKVDGWRRIFIDHQYILEKYDYIAFFDDDIIASADEITEIFNKGIKENLLMWQPSLTWDSYTTYAGFIKNPLFEMRFVSYIEMMCPVISTNYLREILPLFSMGFESGIDLIWCSVAKDRQKRFAILDCVTVKHTRPVGQKKVLNGFFERVYEDDIFMCLDKFSMRWPPLIAYSAVMGNGYGMISQIPVSICSFVYILSIFKSPKGDFYNRIKTVLDHIRHQITRRPYYGNSDKIKEFLRGRP